MDALTASPLCPAPLELQLDGIHFAAPELVVTAAARRHVVACPKCGHASMRVHSKYRRTLADLPWHGLRVRLDVHVRRFFCDVPVNDRLKLRACDLLKFPTAGACSVLLSV